MHDAATAPSNSTFVNESTLRRKHLGETRPLRQGVQARRKALRILHIHGMEVRKKKPRGFKKQARGFR